MDNIKKDNYYLNKIIDDMQFMISHTSNKSLDDMVKDELLIDSIMFRLIQISENATKISQTFKDNNKEISWNAIKGLRNRIVHDYGSVDYTVIYDTVMNDIPNALKKIKNIGKN